MNQFYLILVLATAMTGQAQARIGFTLEQCRTAYGKEVKSAATGIVPQQRAYGFVSDNLYVYAILSKEGKVVDITYFDNQAKVALSASSQAALWNLNVDKGRVWDDTFYRTIALNTGWDGKRAYKKLGAENFAHSVLSESNGPNALVENASKLGFQIRTMDQFWLEQKAVKQLAVKQGAIRS
jgi:hypothetical protein